MCHHSISSARLQPGVDAASAQCDADTISLSLTHTDTPPRSIRTDFSVLTELGRVRFPKQSRSVSALRFQKKKKKRSTALFNDQAAATTTLSQHRQIKRWGSSQTQKRKTSEKTYEMEVAKKKKKFHSRKPGLKKLIHYLWIVWCFRRVGLLWGQTWVRHRSQNNMSSWVETNRCECAGSCKHKQELNLEKVSSTRERMVQKTGMRTCLVTRLGSTCTNTVFFFEKPVLHNWRDVAGSKSFTITICDSAASRQARISQILKYTLMTKVVCFFFISLLDLACRKLIIEVTAVFVSR